MNSTSNQPQFCIPDDVIKTISQEFILYRDDLIFDPDWDDIPTTISIKENGCWIYTNEMMYDIYSPAKFYEKIIEWMIDDINNIYLANYYYLLKDYPSFIEFCNQRIKSADFIDIEVGGILPELYQWCSYSLIVYPKYWQDDFIANPIHWEWTNSVTENFGFPVQVAQDPYHRAYYTQEFITELFVKYCPSWQVSEIKSKKKVYVFTRAYSYSDDYEWCVVVQTPKVYRATFQVVLSKKNNKKISPKDIVFQCRFIIPYIDEFFPFDTLSAWKANAIFRYHYVERYLDYIEPLIAERLK